MTVAFDIIITGPWDGVTGAERGQSSVDASAGGSILMYATFSNTPGTPQSFPHRPDDQEVDPLTGATEIDTLGYDRDAVFPIEVTFAHDSEWFSIAIDGFPPFVGSSFAIDNLEVTTSTAPDTEFRSELDIVVAGGDITITGAVPTEEHRDEFVDRVSEALGDRVVGIDLDVVGGIDASWLLSIAGIIRVLDGIDDLTWNLQSFLATAAAVVPDEEAHERLILQLVSVGGPRYGTDANDVSIGG